MPETSTLLNGIAAQRHHCLAHRTWSHAVKRVQRTPCDSRLFACLPDDLHHPRKSRPPRFWISSVPYLIARRTAQARLLLREIRNVVEPRARAFRCQIPGVHTESKSPDSALWRPFGVQIYAAKSFVCAKSVCKLLIFVAWGARGPGFKSRRPDQLTLLFFNT